MQGQPQPGLTGPTAPVLPRSTSAGKAVVPTTKPKNKPPVRRKATTSVNGKSAIKTVKASPKASATTPTSPDLGESAKLPTTPANEPPRGGGSASGDVGEGVQLAILVAEQITLESEGVNVPMLESPVQNNICSTGCENSKNASSDEPKHVERDPRLPLTPGGPPTDQVDQCRSTKPVYHNVDDRASYVDTMPESRKVHSRYVTRGRTPNSESLRSGLGDSSVLTSHRSCYSRLGTNCSAAARYICRNTTTILRKLCCCRSVPHTSLGDQQDANSRNLNHPVLHDHEVGPTQDAIKLCLMRCKLLIELRVSTQTPSMSRQYNAHGVSAEQRRFNRHFVDQVIRYACKGRSIYRFQMSAGQERDGETGTRVSYTLKDAATYCDMMRVDRLPRESVTVIEDTLFNMTFVEQCEALCMASDVVFVITDAVCVLNRSTNNGLECVRGIDSSGTRMTCRVRDASLGSTTFGGTDDMGIATNLGVHDTLGIPYTERDSYYCCTARVHEVSTLRYAVFRVVTYELPDAKVLHVLVKFKTFSGAGAVYAKRHWGAEEFSPIQMPGFKLGTVQVRWSIYLEEDGAEWIHFRSFMASGIHASEDICKIRTTAYYSVADTPNLNSSTRMAILKNDMGKEDTEKMAETGGTMTAMKYLAELHAHNEREKGKEKPIKPMMFNELKLTIRAPVITASNAANPAFKSIFYLVNGSGAGRASPSMEHVDVINSFNTRQFTPNEKACALVETTNRDYRLSDQLHASITMFSALFRRNNGNCDVAKWSFDDVLNVQKTTDRKKKIINNQMIVDCTHRHSHSSLYRYAKTTMCKQTGYIRGDTTHKDYRCNVSQVKTEAGAVKKGVSGGVLARPIATFVDDAAYAAVAAHAYPLSEEMARTFHGYFCKKRPSDVIDTIQSMISTRPIDMEVRMTLHHQRSFLDLPEIEIDSTDIDAIHFIDQCFMLTGAQLKGDELSSAKMKGVFLLDNDFTNSEYQSSYPVWNACDASKFDFTQTDLVFRYLTVFVRNNFARDVAKEYCNLISTERTLMWLQKTKEDGNNNAFKTSLPYTQSSGTGNTTVLNTLLSLMFQYLCYEELLVTLLTLEEIKSANHTKEISAAAFTMLQHFGAASGDDGLLGCVPTNILKVVASRIGLTMTRETYRNPTKPGDYSTTILLSTVIRFKTPLLNSPRVPVFLPASPDVVRTIRNALTTTINITLVNPGVVYGFKSLGMFVQMFKTFGPIPVVRQLCYAYGCVAESYSFHEEEAKAEYLKNSRLMSWNNAIIAEDMGFETLMDHYRSFMKTGGMLQSEHASVYELVETELYEAGYDTSAVVAHCEELSSAAREAGGAKHVPPSAIHKFVHCFPKFFRDGDEFMEGMEDRWVHLNPGGLGARIVIPPTNGSVPAIELRTITKTSKEQKPLKRKPSVPTTPASSVASGTPSECQTISTDPNECTTADI